MSDLNNDEGASSKLDKDEGASSKLVPTGFIALFGILLLVATGALLYGLYAACPSCELQQDCTTTANTTQPGPSSSPGATPSPTPQSATSPASQTTLPPSSGATPSPTPEPELRLVAVSPNSGPITGCNLVRLDGIGLNNVKEVRFGGQPATLVGLPTLTSLTVKPAAHIEGRVDVVVSDSQSRDTSGNPFFYTYTCPPPSGRSVIWLMILAGALGAILHGLRSFAWYVGNRELVWSWIPTYLGLPFIGGATSTVFYLIIRGGLMTGAPENNDVFGLMAIGTLTGLFSQQALEKLRKISEGIFTPPPPGKDSRPEKPGFEVEKIVPAKGKENELVAILGSGFVKEKVRVRFDDKPADVVKAEDQVITVNTPEHAPGEAKVVVVQDRTSIEVPGGFTYENVGPLPSDKTQGQEVKQEDKK